MSSLHDQYSLTSLPNEILLHILSFGVEEFRNDEQDKRKWQAKYVINFQSLNSKMNSLMMKEFYDKFWWKIFESHFGKLGKIFNEVELMKNVLIRKNELKRKILLAIYVNAKYFKYQKPMFHNKYLDIRVTVLGEAGVGKSKLIYSFIYSNFTTEYDPTIEDSYRKFLDVDNSQVALDVLDTGNWAEEYSAIREQYLRSSDSFIFVTSVTDRESLSQLQTLLQQLVKVKDREVNDMSIVFSINKIDLLEEYNREHVIDEYRNEIMKFSNIFNLINASIVETSAKTGQNVDFIFEQVARGHMCGTYEAALLLKKVTELDVAIFNDFKKKKCQLM